MEREWVCTEKGCDESVMWSYESLATSGIPQCPKHDSDMELVDEDE